MGTYALRATPKQDKLPIILNNQLNSNDSQMIASWFDSAVAGEEGRSWMDMV